jgi:sporulation protein YlmC with PRC-barrel domain
MVSDQNCIKYAEMHGIEVSYKKSSEDRIEQKGVVTLHEMKTIGISSIGSENASVVKVILLHEPKEANFRKIPLQKTVPYKPTELLRDKLVVDSEGIAIGYIDSTVLYRNSLGIRVYSAKPTDTVNLSWLFQYLEKIGRNDIRETLEKYLGEGRRSHDFLVRKDDLEEFMRDTSLNFRIPESALYDQQVKELLMDIPWEIIHKIGDVVLLKLTLSEIKSKGH